MSLFGDKLTIAHSRITALCAILASTGFKLDAVALADSKNEAAVMPTADAFRAHLAETNKAAVAAAVDPLNVQLATAATSLAAAQAEATAFRAGLTDAGIKLGDFVTTDKAAGDTPEAKAKDAAAKNAASIKVAVETAVAGKATRQIAAAGHPNAIPVEPGTDDKASTAVAPKTAAEFKAGLAACQTPGERTTYFRKHKAQFGL